MADAAGVLEASADLTVFRCAKCGALRAREPMVVHLRAAHGFGSAQTTLEIDDAIIRAYQPVDAQAKAEQASEERFRTAFGNLPERRQAGA